jgi:hypothetical protein
MSKGNLMILQFFLERKSNKMDFQAFGYHKETYLEWLRVVDDANSLTNRNKKKKRRSNRNILKIKDRLIVSA